MNKLFPNDITDNEIRIVSSKTITPAPKPPKRPRGRIIAIIAVVLIALAAVAYGLFTGGASEPDELAVVSAPVVVVADSLPADSAIPAPPPAPGYVQIVDTVVGRAPLLIFKPVGLTPTLHVGADVLADSTVRFAVQAADVRSDNGGIVGAYVLKGELLSKGQAKSGFCAVIGGKMTIGVADATPLLEQALESEGYFFRQYPLVVGGQLVENKPKGESLRKALAELGGEPVVIMSREKMTFHNFSTALVDLGVTNAIYLVGGKSFGFAIDRAGIKTEFGAPDDLSHYTTNYLVWR